MRKGELPKKKTDYRRKDITEMPCRGIAWERTLFATVKGKKSNSFIWGSQRVV